MAEVGRKLGISERQVQRYLRKLGVPVRPSGQRAKYPDLGPRKCANPNCDVIFKPKPYHDAHGRGKYHSKKCFDDDQRTYPEPGERECRLASCTNRFRPAPWLAARGFGFFCCEEHYWASEELAAAAAEHAKESWRLGGSFAAAAFNQWPRSGRTRQRWLGRWEGQRFGTLGGRPQVALSPEQAAEMEKLITRGWGRRAIASKLLVSERAVRKALDARKQA